MFLFNIQSLCKIIYLSKTCFHGGILVQLTWFSRYMKLEFRFFIRDLKDTVNTYIYKSRYNISRSFTASKLTSSFWIDDITFYQDSYLKNSPIFVLSVFFHLEITTRRRIENQPPYWPDMTCILCRLNFFGIDV